MADAADRHRKIIARLHPFERHQRAGQNHFAGFEADAEAPERVGEPSHAVHRAAQRGCACAGADDFAVFLHHHAASGQIELARTHGGVAQKQHAAGCVVGNGVLDFDLPAFNARIHNFKTRHHAFGGGEHIGGADAGAHQVFFQNKGDFTFGARLYHALANVDFLPLAIHHFVGEVAEIGLVHAQHVLHGMRGEADFFADDAFAGIQTVLQKGKRNMVGVFHADVVETFGERAHGFALQHGLIQLLAAGGQELNRLDASLSRTREGSEIYTLNAQGRADVSHETADLISAAPTLSKATGGAFDPTPSLIPI